jgi:glycosyltransferase involved in cell wall biosynthesis
MTRPLRIAHVGPIAMAIPPAGSGSVEAVTSLLTEGLVRRGLDVTLFATGNSITSARLHAAFDQGYGEDPHMWPWELYEMLNLSAAVERAREFDVIHYQAAYYPMSLAFARLCPTPILQTLHHLPSPSEVALWRRHPEVAFVAVSREQARLLAGLTIAGTVLHGIDTTAFPFREHPDDYLLFLGRFTAGKGVLAAIDVARRAGLRLIMAAPRDEYYEQHVAPHVDGTRVVYAGEVRHQEKVALLGGARALLYPVQEGEPFGLVLPEAMACGTPVAALGRGAVREVVDDGVTGRIFADLDGMVAGLPEVFALDRRGVRARAAARFDAERMVDGYVEVYERVAQDRHERWPRLAPVVLT